MANTFADLKKNRKSSFEKLTEKQLYIRTN